MVINSPKQAIALFNLLATFLASSSLFPLRKVLKFSILRCKILICSEGTSSIIFFKSSDADLSINTLSRKLLTLSGLTLVVDCTFIFPVLLGLFCEFETVDPCLLAPPLLLYLDTDPCLLTPLLISLILWLRTGGPHTSSIQILMLSSEIPAKIVFFMTIYLSSLTQQILVCLSSHQWISHLLILPKLPHRTSSHDWLKRLSHLEHQSTCQLYPYLNEPIS